MCATTAWPVEDRLIRFIIRTAWLLLISTLRSLRINKLHRWIGTRFDKRELSWHSQKLGELPRLSRIRYHRSASSRESCICISCRVCPMSGQLLWESCYRLFYIDLLLFSRVETFWKFYALRIFSHARAKCWGIYIAVRLPSRHDQTKLLFLRNV